MKTTTRPSGRSVPILRQICNLFPHPVFNERWVQYGFDTRSYSEWSHLVTMLYAHLSRANSLNDVCDGLRMHAAVLACVKEATPPSKNNLSNCNKTRNADFMEALYWRTMEFLCRTNGGFGSSKCRKDGAAGKIFLAGFSEPRPGFDGDEGDSFLIATVLVLEAFVYHEPSSPG